MKHIAVCIAAVVALATPASAQQGAQAQEPNVATSGPARSHVTGRFHLDLANSNNGALNRIDDEHPDDNAAPTLNSQASAQAQANTPQVQLPPPQTIRQSQQVRTDRRVRPNPGVFGLLPPSPRQ